MTETSHNVDIDLTTVPAQRVSPEDSLQVIHHEPAISPPPVARTRDRRLWLGLIAVAAAAGFAIGVPAGLSMAPLQPAPAPSPGHNDIDGLLLDPLDRQQPQPASPTDQQDLINQMLTPRAG